MVTKLKNSHCDKTKKKTKIVTKLKKTKIVTKLKTSNCDKIQKLKLCQNSKT